MACAALVVRFESTAAGATAFPLQHGARAVYPRAVNFALAPLPASPVPPGLLDEAETLTGALARLVDRFPDYECLTLLDRHGAARRLSLVELWTRACQIHSSLRARGLEAGDLAVVVLPTGPELVAAYFGIMLAGGIPALAATPSNRLADRGVYAARIGAILADAQARILYGDREVAELFREHAAVVPKRTVVVSSEDVEAASEAPSVALARAEDVATVQYSSGATGVPKGVLLTHRAVLNNIRALRQGLGLRTADVSVNWIPLYHDMGLIDAFLLPLLSGCPTVLIPTMDFMRQPALWLWAIHHCRGAHAWAPNFAYALCAARIPDEELAGLDLSSWRIAVSAAEPILAHTVAAFQERFAPYGFAPQAMTPVYGLAENVTAATAHPVDERPLVETIDRAALASEHHARPTARDGLASVAVGRALPGCTIEIRGADRRVLEDRRVGTIWLRTNCLFSGYHRNQQATEQALVDGWLDTGDQGYLADGMLYFVAREKDLIVVGGEKYAPHDVEMAIDRVDGVREGCAAVFGVLNEERGTEDLAAVVETRLTGETALTELRDRIRAAVTRATGLGLRHVILVQPGGIEKTTSGKLARRATRRRYADRLVASGSASQTGDGHDRP